MPKAIGELLILQNSKGKIKKKRTFVEMMSGKENFTAAMTDQDQVGQGFEIEVDKSEDILTLAGVIWCSVMILECKPKSIVTSSPQCNSWVVLNRCTSGTLL
eukprot:879187-Karenia_brevis.AAC.1